MPLTVVRTATRALEIVDIAPDHSERAHQRWQSSTSFPVWQELPDSSATHHALASAEPRNRGQSSTEVMNYAHVSPHS